MASFLKFLKRHIIAIIVIVVLLVIAGSLFLVARSFLKNGNEGTIYGDRLDGIDKVGLKNESLDKIIGEMKKNQYVKSANYRVEGRTINFQVDVAKGTSVANAKKVSLPILPGLTEDEKSFYSIQVFVTCKEDSENESYPLNGYKHRTSSDLLW